VLGRLWLHRGYPPVASAWKVDLSAARAASLAATLEKDYELAMLFKKLATCVEKREILPPGGAALDKPGLARPEGGLRANVRPPGSPEPWCSARKY